jgi:hypothetical protein
MKQAPSYFEHVAGAPDRSKDVVLWPEPRKPKPPNPNTPEHFCDKCHIRKEWCACR